MVGGAGTRRGLLVASAGAAVAVAGCGSTEKAPPPEPQLLGAIAAPLRALPAVYEQVPGTVGGELGQRVADLLVRLERAGARESDPIEAPGGDPLEAALALEQRALAAAVTATGELRADAASALAAQAVIATAQHAAILRGRLGRDPLEVPFPDGRTA